MGFYPVCPGTDEYTIGLPLLKKVTINLPNNEKVEIKAANNDEKNRYIKSIKVNGRDYSNNYFNHTDFIKGMTIDFDMSDTPNTQRGIGDDNVPYSFSREK